MTEHVFINAIRDAVIFTAVIFGTPVLLGFTLDFLGKMIKGARTWKKDR